MDLMTQDQILDTAVCISHHTYTFGKGMNSSLQPSMGKQSSKMDSLVLVWQPAWKKEN